MKMFNVLSMIVFLALIMCAVPVFAQGLKWSDTYSATDVVLTGNNTDSGNVAYGTLLEYKTVSGNKPIGFGGIAVGVNAEHKMNFSIMGFTFLDDMVWSGFTVNQEGLKMNNLKNNITPVIGVSLIKFGAKVTK